jgi:hypothetical protein
MAVASGTYSSRLWKMLSYPVQLDLKRNVVLKAYQNFAGDFMSQYFTALVETHIGPDRDSWVVNAADRTHHPVALAVRLSNKNHSSL